MAESSGVYSISAVSRLVGVASDTIRAWERRYGAVRPARSSSGRRLYSHDDVQRLRLLGEAVRRGNAIGVVAPLDDDALSAMLADASVADTAASEVTLGGVVASTLAALERYDRESCERAIAMAVATLPIDLVTDELLVPLLDETGDRWHRGTISIAQERLVSTTVRRLALNALTTLSQGSRAPRVLVGTPLGESHDLGALLAAANALACGVACEFVGAELPAEEYARLARARPTDVIVLGVLQRPPAPSIAAQVRLLRETLSGDVEIWLGGRAAGDVLDSLGDVDVVPLPTLAVFREKLQRLGEHGTGRVG